MLRMTPSQGMKASLRMASLRGMEALRTRMVKTTLANSKMETEMDLVSLNLIMRAGDYLLKVIIRMIK